jgi:hypothetical protein
MVLGATQRYREKYFTIVFYSVMPQSGTQYSSNPPAAVPAPVPTTSNISSNISNLNSNTPASNVNS